MPNGHPNFPHGWESSDLCRLAAAARRCVRDYGMDGELALSYVVWETPEITAALLNAPVKERVHRRDLAANQWLKVWDQRKKKAA